MLRSSRVAILLAGMLALAGCREVEVYDQLSQRDANEMTALLLVAGVDAQRVTHKDGTFAVSVAEDDFAQAVTLIDRSGLPKPKFATMTDVLSDDRLIASPSEERARLNYALSQELSRTVSGIDGIVIARVHLATPSNDPLSRRKSEPPTASIAIHHRADLATGGVVPRIKTLVANAVDGLEYDRVSVALFATSDGAWDKPAYSPPQQSAETAKTAERDTSSSWSNRVDSGDAEFELPAATVSRSQSSSLKRSDAQQTVTPASVGEFSMTPAIAAVLGGGFVILLLVGHALLSGMRKPQLNDDGRGRRHQAKR